MGRSITIILGISLVVAISIFAVYAYFTIYGEQEIPDKSEPKAQIDNLSWKKYRNENYGITFKYPGDLNTFESYSRFTGDTGIVFAPAEHETGIDPIGNSFILNPTLTLTFSCLVPENVSAESWENNFEQPLTSGDPFHDITSNFIQTYTIAKRKLFVFEQGCYECYGGLDEPHPESEKDGFSVYSCQSGINKHGNKAAGCVALITERQKIDSPEMEQLKKFFFNDFIPTIDIQHASMIKNCDSLGGSVG